jgi:hypothetical protein
MKTDDLVAMLSTNVEPVDRRKVERTVSAALAIGGVAALVAVSLTLGVRSDLTVPGSLMSLVLKVVFTLGAILLAAISLIRHARPGGEHKAPIGLVALPFVAIMFLAAVSLASAPSSHWESMIVGDKWLECLLSIPLIAIVPFAIVVWAVRQMGPTDLVRAGALAGLVAGGLSATAYALHCTDDSLPFVAIWYGGTIALCTFAGARLGRWLLHW